MAISNRTQELQQIVLQYQSGAISRNDAYEQCHKIVESTIRYVARTEAEQQERLRVLLGKDDYETVGRLALLNCLDKYRPDGGSHFSTFWRLCFERDVVAEIKKQKAAFRGGGDITVSYDADLMDDGRRVEPDKAILTSEFYEAFRNIDLNDTQRKVVYGILAGKSPADITHENGWKWGYVATVLRRLAPKFEAAGFSMEL